ncbi:MAG: polysaccharide deacetylase family protein [Terracidiphilus sp.]|nr:polysaccharide deacetylase family protein [Terracidiphilus sp.]
MSSRKSVRCAALLYHHVGSQQAGVYPEMSIEPDLFTKQMDWLVRHGYTAIRSHDWFTWRSDSAELPKNPVMITFDDAYAEIGQYALPILKSRGMTATVFVVTAHIGATNAWDEQNDYATLPLMTAQEIRKWDAEEFEFGAHGRTHADLTRLDDTALADEIAGSGEDLARLLGKPTTSFAYPFGAWNERARAVASEHYSLAFSCITGTNCMKTDPHLLRRTFLPSRVSMVDFALTARTGGLHRLEELRARLALRTRMRRLFN